MNYDLRAMKYVICDLLQSKNLIRKVKKEIE